MSDIRPVTTVFFDVDFTLIYPGPTFQGPGYAEACRRFGVEVDPQRFDAAVKASSFILDDVEEPLYQDDLFIHYTASIIEHMGGRGAGVIEAARSIYLEWAVIHHFELYDDAITVLQALLERGLHLGLISNSHRSLAAFLEHFALTDVVSTTISSHEHGYLKPHPSIFVEALARAGATAETSLMVGDSLTADVGGALAVGMRALLLRRSGDHPPGVPAGVPVIRSLHEVLQHV